MIGLICIVKKVIEQQNHYLKFVVQPLLLSCDDLSIIKKSIHFDSLCILKNLISMFDRIILFENPSYYGDF